VQHEPQGIQQQGRQDNDAEEIGSIANQRSESAGSKDCENQIPWWKKIHNAPSRLYRDAAMREIKMHSSKRIYPEWNLKKDPFGERHRKAIQFNGREREKWHQYWITEINLHRKGTVFPDWSILAFRYMENKKRDHKARYEKQAKHQAIQKKEYRQRPEVKARHAERQRKYCQDPFFRVKKNLRRRLVEVAKSGKAQSTMKYIGCTSGELRTHLERQFEKWMSWENYGTRWHIDHIHPVDSFDHSDPRQIAICWHYSNLRPLCALVNSSKGSRITIPQMNLPI
jgi:hypothetical protein